MPQRADLHTASSRRYCVPSVMKDTRVGSATCARAAGWAGAFGDLAHRALESIGQLTTRLVGNRPRSARRPTAPDALPPAPRARGCRPRPCRQWCSRQAPPSASRPAGSSVTPRLGGRTARTGQRCGQCLDLARPALPCACGSIRDPCRSRQTLPASGDRPCRTPSRTADRARGHDRDRRRARQPPAAIARAAARAVASRIGWRLARPRQRRERLELAQIASRAATRSARAVS